MAVAPASGLLHANEVRYLAAAILEPDPGEELTVIGATVDSLTPPALMMLKGDPWLTPGSGGTATMGPCTYEARLAVWAIASRYEPGPGIDKTDELEAYVLQRMRANAYTWNLVDVTSPRVSDQWSRGVEYLFSIITYRVPVTV